MACQNLGHGDNAHLGDPIARVGPALGCMISLLGGRTKVVHVTFELLDGQVFGRKFLLPFQGRKYRQAAGRAGNVDDARWIVGLGACFQQRQEALGQSQRPKKVCGNVNL